MTCILAARHVFGETEREHARVTQSGATPIAPTSTRLSFFRAQFAISQNLSYSESVAMRAYGHSYEHMCTVPTPLCIKQTCWRPRTVVCAQPPTGRRPPGTRRGSRGTIRISNQDLLHVLLHATPSNGLRSKRVESAFWEDKRKQRPPASESAAKSPSGARGTRLQGHSRGDV